MKVALIGCGMIAPSHFRALKQIVPDADVSLCDINRDRAEGLGTKWGVRSIHTSYDDLFRSGPDVVHILTPPSSHATIAMKAILSGCHVLVEKPVTETAKEFVKLAELAREQEKVFAPCYSTLGMPVVMKVRRQIASGILGKLIAVHCTYAASWPGNAIPYGDPTHWAYALPGGVLRNWADHPASLIVGVMDPIEEKRITFSRRNVLPFDSPDLLHVVMRSRDQIGSFTLSLGHGNTDIRTHLTLEGGSIALDLRRMLMSLTIGKGPQNMIKRALSGALEGYSFISGTFSNVAGMMTGKLQREPGIFNIIRNFYRTIAREDELLVGHDVTLGIVQLLEDIWKEIDHEPGDDRSSR